MYGINALFSYRVVSYRSLRCYSSDSTKKLLEFLVDMPKATSTRIAEAQRQRQRISKKSEKYGPSTVYLQVLGSGARGAPSTLYLFTDQKRYLFNCGECTQRLAHEHKVKLSRLDHIFITSKTWKNIGGLPGLSLTLQDVGVPNITLHGPEGLDELYSATKRFVIMKDMQVTMAKCSTSEDFEDSVMSVKYVLLGPNENILTGTKPVARRPRSGSADKEYEEFSHDDIDYYHPETRNLESQTVSPTARAKHVRETAASKDKAKQRATGAAEKDPMKKKTEKVLHELQKKAHCSVAYICTLKKRLGTLDLAKCVELGVKPGPMLGQLKKGQDVVLPDGSLVLSKDVKTPDESGPVFIVIEVPELSYLKEAEFSAHFFNDTNPPENIPTLIVHFTPPHVFHHPTYRAFMSLFGPVTRHLVLNEQNLCLGSEAVHRTQHKLHLLDPDIFPLLRDVSVPAVWNAPPPIPKTNSPVRLKGLEELKNKIALAQFQNIINLEGSAKGDGHAPAVDDGDSVTKVELLAGRTLTMYHLRPRKQLDRSAEPKLHIQDYIQETMDVDGFVGSLEQFRRLVDGIRYVKTDAKEYPKVVFLGTGSCIPSKTRNTSAIVLHIDESCSILMDCGEGTFGQLVRFYGPKKVNAFLRTLKAVYISHLHADHHIGLIGVIQARRQAFEEFGPQSEDTPPPPPLYLLAPGQIVTWLTLYDNQFERLKNQYTLLPNQNLLYDSHSHQNNELTAAVLSAIGVQSITTCQVAHCPNAFGVAIQINERYKVTYSGDTLPCEELVKIGENSTLLIHEATMEDELAEEARTKMHSTTTQAIDIGKQMNARYTVLTHFSQRYARLPRLNAHILNDNKSVGIAFDNMQINMSDLELLPHMYAPLQLMFADHCVEMELKAAQRQRIRERRASPPVVQHDSRAPSANRGRRTSSSRDCNTTQAPHAHARYRESNASRLRQEIKGMTVSGTVRKPRSRSNSASSNILPDSRKSPARSNNSRQPSCERSSKVSAKVEEIITPAHRSVSENFSKDNLPSAKLANICSGYVVDTRSKTLSTVGPGHVTGEELMDIMNNKKGSRCSSYKSVDNGYGKPLVTPMNKKLTIRRDMPWPSRLDSSNERCSASIGGGTKSPTRSWKAENRESSSPITPQRPEIKKTRIPTKATYSGNKLRASNTSPNVFPDTKIPTMRSTITNKSLRASASSQHRPTGRSSGRLPNAQDIMSVPSIKTKIQRHDLRDIKHIAHDSIQSSPRSPSRGRSPIPKRFPAESIRTPSRSPNRGRSPVPKRIPAGNNEAEPLKKPQSSNKDLAAQKSKGSLNKEPFVHPLPSRQSLPSHVHSNRSFKPQLEDIKSSYLLLNKKAQDLNMKACATAAGRIKTNVPQPNAFNEEMRKQQLIEVKKKFQSKRFWTESKYDKIEGLNWITWK